MLFNSFEFAIFLPIVFAIYWLLPHRFRWSVILVSSYYFYMSWNIKYGFLILLTTLISYICALLLECSKTKKQKKVFLTATLTIVLGILFIFKYFNFFSHNIYYFLKGFSLRVPKITLLFMLPVGISFYTFQSIGYIIDVYRGEIKAEKHFGKYAAFVSFFPQLVAGPIERTANLLPQLTKKRSFNYENASYGIKLMAWGLFKKIVIADTLAIYVDKVYNFLPKYTGFSLIAATVLFSIQIYCDFSGYSDIAVGTAKLFNINLIKNFSSPYFSSSIREFWSRWHISLSTWFKDYIYIPLGGNRCSKTKHCFNLLITFLISGLWHGANWTFIIWGGIHGFAQIIENNFCKKTRTDSKNTTRYFFRVLLVFIFCNIAWIFFRAANINDALYILSHAFDGITTPVSYIRNGLLNMDFDIFEIENVIVMICILFAFDYYNLKGDLIEKISSLNIVLRWFIYFVFIFLTISLIPAEYGGQFIYFQF